MKKEDPSISSRIERLEKEKNSAFPAWLRDGVTLLSPIIVVLIGVYSQSALQETKEKIEKQQLAMRQIETAQSLMTALFEEEYDGAVALRHLLRMIHPEVERTIGESVDRILRKRENEILKTAEKLNESELETLQSLRRASIDDSISQEKTLHVVLVSIKQAPGSFARLIGFAERVTEDSNVPDAEIWCSSTGPGYLALTLGRHSVEDAWQVGEHANKVGWDERNQMSKKFYVTAAPYIYKQVWPPEETGEKYDPQSIPCLAKPDKN